MQPKAPFSYGYINYSKIKDRYELLFTTDNISRKSLCMRDPAKFPPKDGSHTYIASGNCSKNALLTKIIF